MYMMSVNASLFIRVKGIPPPPPAPPPPSPHPLVRMTGKFLQFFVLPFSQKSISLFCLTTLLDVFRTYLMHSSKYFCLHDLNTSMLLQGFAEALTGVSFKRTTKYIKETAIRMLS